MAKAVRKIDECEQARAERLDLHGQGMITLPPRLFTLTHVTMLRLGANHLRELPRDIAKLTQLRVLNLMSNQLVDLPRDILELKHLETLFLYQNQFTIVPWFVGSMPSLMHVAINNNPLDYAALIPDVSLRAVVMRGETSADWKITAEWLKEEWKTRSATDQQPALRTWGSLASLESENSEAGSATLQRPMPLSHGLIPYGELAVDTDQELGIGPWGQVFAVSYHNQSLAARQFRQDLLESNEEREKLTHTMERLYHLFHRNVLKVVGLCMDHPPNGFVITTVCSPVSLRNALSDPSRSGIVGDQQRRRAIAKQIAEGVHYMHVHEVFHGALSTDSILFDSHDVVKIADVGILDHVPIDQRARIYPFRLWPPEWMAAVVLSLPGSPEAVPANGESKKLLRVRALSRKEANAVAGSPEASNKANDDNNAPVKKLSADRASDAWGLGMTLFELHSMGALPYSTLADDCVVKQFVYGERGIPDCPDGCPETDWALIRGLCAYQRQSRTSLLALLMELERLLTDGLL